MLPHARENFHTRKSTLSNVSKLVNDQNINFVSVIAHHLPHFGNTNNGGSAVEVLH